MTFEKARLRDLEEKEELRRLLKDIELLLDHLIFRLREQDPRVDGPISEIRPAYLGKIRPKSRNR